MFSFFGSSASATKKSNSIPAKIEDFQKKLTQENMGLVDKKGQLQLLISSNGKSALNSTNGQRLVTGMRRHHEMMKVYQTSLQALETTLQNLEMQRITSETQKLIGRAPSANFNNIEDNLEDMANRDHEMAELSQLMAQHAELPSDNGDFLEEIGFVIPDTDDRPKPDSPPVAVMNFPSPPSYLEKLSSNTAIQDAAISNTAKTLPTKAAVSTQPF